MYFNSLPFLVFLPIVWSVYWLTPRRFVRAQNLVIIAASYVFYGWWDWRFLSLIAFSSLIDFVICLRLRVAAGRLERKALLWTSLVVNFGLLGVFKYSGWFLESLSRALSSVGLEAHLPSLHIVLPVGISFYTFQTVSYTIDVYRGKLEPTKDWVALFAYVSFFPQLVAGPIERATSLLGQFQRERTFSLPNAAEGLRLMLWGAFKKIVIADNCAVVVDFVFGQTHRYSGSTLLLGAAYFGFQIYGDFSGYSDIARGVAKLFGIELMVNFRTPYFSRDMGEFWRRWHVSLSSWFREYLYIPLGGSRHGKLATVRNVLVVFAVSGLWHGANWTFLIWGLLNGVLVAPLVVWGGNRPRRSREPSRPPVVPSVRDVVQIGSTFLLTCLAWVFFRSENLSQAADYLQRMFTIDLFSVPTERRFAPVLFAFVCFEWVYRGSLDPLGSVSESRAVRWTVYAILLMLILFLGSPQRYAFIYFQF